MPHALAEDRRAYAASRRARVRQELVERLGGKCSVCGAAGDLKFAHDDPATKLFTIDGSLCRPRAVLEAEADKCHLLCPDHYQPSLRGARHHTAGEDAHGAVLTENEARAIKYSPESHRVLADRYVVSKTTVQAIKSGRTWKHVLPMRP